MPADTQGNDLAAVGVPIGGLVAVAPYASGNVIADADMGKTPLTLPEPYDLLGLVKQDGAPQHTREAGDATEFWQKGYLLAGEGTRTIQVNLAENNAAVIKLTEGKAPNEDGVIYVDSSLPDARVMLFVATKFKNGTEERHNGVAQVTAIEVDQNERGSVRGRSVTLTWQEDELFDGSPFKVWHGVPGATVVTSVTAGIPGSFSPSGAAVPANIAALRALGDIGQDDAWTTGQYVAIGSGNVHWNGTDWATGAAS